MRDRRRREKLKDPWIIKGFGRGLDEIQFKEEDRLVDLKDKTRPPLEVPTGTTADHATKYDPPGANPSAKTEQNLKKPVQATSKTKNVKTERMAKKKKSDRIHAITL